VWLSEGDLLVTSIDDCIFANKLLWHNSLNAKFLRGDKVVYVPVIKKTSKCGIVGQTVEWVPLLRKPQILINIALSHSDNNWREGQLRYLSLMQIWSEHWLWIDEHKIFSTKSLFWLGFQSNGDRQMVLIIYHKSRYVMTSLQAITNYFVQHSVRISYCICIAPNIKWMMSLLQKRTDLWSTP
jgi:hypothetical protein